MLRTVRPETSSGNFQNTNVGFFREKSLIYLLQKPLHKGGNKSLKLITELYIVNMMIL